MSVHPPPGPPPLPGCIPSSPPEPSSYSSWMLPSSSCNPRLAIKIFAGLGGHARENQSPDRSGDFFRIRIVPERQGGHSVEGVEWLRRHFRLGQNSSVSKVAPQQRTRGGSPADSSNDCRGKLRRPGSGSGDDLLEGFGLGKLTGGFQLTSERSVKGRYY